MVTTHRSPVYDRKRARVFSTLFSRNRVEASVFLLSATNGNNRLVITRKFRTRDLLSPSRIIEKKKNLSLAPVFPRCKFRSRKRKKRRHPLENQTFLFQSGSHQRIPLERILFFFFFLSTIVSSISSRDPGSLETRRIVDRMRLERREDLSPQNLESLNVGVYTLVRIPGQARQSHLLPEIVRCGSRLHLTLGLARNACCSTIPPHSSPSSPSITLAYRRTWPQI